MDSCKVCSGTHATEAAALQCVETAWAIQCSQITRLRIDLAHANSTLADLGERSTNSSCCDPRFVKRNDKGEPVGWTITLNEYQRANLLWLMCDIAGYDRKEAVVPGLQTGDWAGEIPNALRAHERLQHYEESRFAPNTSVEDARRWILGSIQSDGRRQALEQAAALCDAQAAEEDARYEALSFTEQGSCTCVLGNIARESARRIRALLKT
jgi:hypothetical protein